MLRRNAQNRFAHKSGVVPPKPGPANPEAFWAPPGNQGPAGGAGPVLQQTPAGIEIKGRGRFRTPEAFEAMLDGLQTMLTTLLERNGRSGSDAACPVIQELDVSQNRLTLEQFETLFVSMGVAGAKVIRYRMFGCPTLDDQVLQSLANFLAGQVTADTAPWELHLSDCAITTDGFLALMDAIETSDLYPRPSPQNPAKGIPLYLRLENNYIAEDAIQQKVDAGLIQTFTKQMGPQMSFPGGPKVNLLARGDWKCQQLIKSALMEKTQAQVPARPNPAPAAFSAKQVPPRNVTTAPLKQVISVPAREFVQFGRAVAATQRTLGGTPAALDNDMNVYIHMSGGRRIGGVVCWVGGIQLAGSKPPARRWQRITEPACIVEEILRGRRLQARRVVSTGESWRVSPQFAPAKDMQGRCLDRRYSKLCDETAAAQSILKRTRRPTRCRRRLLLPGATGEEEAGGAAARTGSVNRAGHGAAAKFRVGGRSGADQDQHWRRQPWRQNWDGEDSRQTKAVAMTSASYPPVSAVRGGPPTVPTDEGTVPPAVVMAQLSTYRVPGKGPTNPVSPAPASQFWRRMFGSFYVAQDAAQAPALGVTTTPAGIRAESSVTKVAPSNGPRPSVAKARPKPQPEQSVAVPPAGSKAATTVRPRGSIGLDAKYRPPGSQETPATKRPRGSVGLASARSRTPAARKEQDAPINSSELPEDWEEHLSEEYGISYFWNRVTNESRWDRPST
ncbi:unnamed protein product [Symbiodinium sp. KB8]|nr:unnamed protein product [Symbiodinium sp. KB8]